MTKRTDTTLRILAATLGGGFGGWLCNQNIKNYIIGSVVGFTWGVVMPFILPRLISGCVWFAEQFERL